MTMSAAGSQIAARSQRSRRTNQAGDDDGATSSTSRRSIATPAAAGASRIPSGARSATRRLNSRVAPGPAGKLTDSTGRGRLPNRLFASATRPARRWARGTVAHAGPATSAIPSSPGWSKVVRPASPSTSSAATSASRSIARAIRLRSALSASGPALRPGISANIPTTGSKRKVPRGNFALRATGRSAKVPPSTTSASPERKRATAEGAGRPFKSMNSRSSASPSDPAVTRWRWSGSSDLPGNRVNGPLPSPSRTIANSGWASSCSRLGRAAPRRISITRSVIATISSIAPTVSLSGLRLAARRWRLSIRATSRASILRPLGQLPDCRRKM